MALYSNVLVALDIFSHYEEVLEKALKLVDKPSDLSLVYVTLPHAYFEPYAVDIGRDFVADICDKAKTKLTDVAMQHGIPTNQIHALMGDPSDEIHNKAQEVQADLIVIGTHGKSGLKLLLGSTANAVLHGVKCDVLAIKIED